MTQQTFLVEIGTEELPPKSLRKLAESFATNFINEMKNANIDHGRVSWFASPRRLALKVANLSAFQADCIVNKRGPAICQSFETNGKLSKAAEAWASSCGITVDQAERLVTDKGEWLMHRAYFKGQPVQTLLVGMLNLALSKLPFEKLMRWSDSEVEFIRPVHTVTLLLGTELILGNLLGIKSSRIILGHRFMGEPEIYLDSADDYPQVLLERGKVIADYEARKALIKKGAELAATSIGGKVGLSENLLEEVASLVEWPVVLTAQFDDKFLKVPAEALVCTMQGNQKYFPVYSVTGNLLPNFIFVANIESRDPQKIIDGNEKVVRSRLADAEFFFKNDCKKRLIDQLPYLNNVLFHQKLGSLRDRTDRVQALAAWIAVQINANVNHVMRSGLLSKCDLMTNMVFEFSETQGVMGMHYARHDGEVEDVAIALNEQYKPRFSGDKLPQSRVSCSLAIADKMDTLTGIFGIQQYPKGDKDPFALRRAALGVIRIVVEKNLLLDLQTLTQQSVSLYGGKISNTRVVEEVVEFMLGRFRTWYQEKGYAVDTIQAVMATNPLKPVDFDSRVKAVSYFRTLKEAKALAAANKRISNILAKSTDLLNDCVQDSALKETAEIQLARHLEVLRDKLEPHFSFGNYQDILLELATLHEPVDAFFKSVMVMAIDNKLRVNRLTLLSKLRKLFLQVADISMLQ